MDVLIYSLLMAYAWPLACVVVVCVLAKAGSDWLQRRNVNVQKHVDERDAEWSRKFETFQASTDLRITNIERALSASQSDFKPMGKHYNPRA